MKLNTDLIEKVVGQQTTTQDIADKSEHYCNQLLRENAKINLVSRAGDVESEIERQFLLSIIPLSIFDGTDNLRWLDIGSGGGFPAIPIAIYRPHDQFELVESTSKKAYFLERTVESLKLDNVRIINSRAEDWLGKSDHQQSYDVLSIKAVTGWNETFRWAKLALSHGGRLMTYKPQNEEPNQGRFSNDFQLLEKKRVNGIMDDVKTRILLFRRK